MPRYHTYSRAIVLGKPDGRSKEGRLLKSVKQELLAYFGGKVTLPQRILVERCAQLSLRLAKYEERALRGELTPHDDRNYTCYSNSLARTLATLGIKPTPKEPSPVDAYDALMKSFARPKRQRVSLDDRVSAYPRCAERIRARRLPELLRAS